MVPKSRDAEADAREDVLQRTARGRTRRLSTPHRKLVATSAFEPEPDSVSLTTAPVSIATMRSRRPRPVLSGAEALRQTIRQASRIAADSVAECGRSAPCQLAQTHKRPPRW